MTSAEYRQAIDALPYGKRLPGAVYLIDPGEDSRIPSLLRITIAELRKRLEIGPFFNLLKFHTGSPKIPFLSYGMRDSRQFLESHRIPLASLAYFCFARNVSKEKSSNSRNDDRKAEIRIIRDFADKLIREGKAKEFLIQHGFHTPGGKLTKRYGG